MRAVCLQDLKIFLLSIQDIKPNLFRSTLQKTYSDWSGWNPIMSDRNFMILMNYLNIYTGPTIYADCMHIVLAHLNL